MAYEYDPAVHTFITRVTDAFGYESSSAYYYLWGLPIENTDRNGEQMSYTFDNRGRITTVRGPHEIASGAPYTIAFDYHPEAAVAYARTRHYDPLQEADIETFTFSDGLARPVQVKKTGIVSAADGALATEGFIVSGKVLYDAFGRAVSAYQPVFETGSDPQTYNPTPDKVAPTRTAYDVLDRTTKVTLPDGAQTTRGYGIGA
jgi:YD repeat-containing protein